jgi:chromosome segregation ATPase
MPSLSAMSSRAVILAQIGKVAEYHASLVDIAAEVTGVRAELAQLRAEAGRLTELLAERDDALSRLEREQADASDEARAATASLRRSDVRLGASREQVATLLQEQHALLTRLGEAERRIGDAEDTGRRLRDALADRELTIEKLRERASQLDAREEQLAMLQHERASLRSRVEEAERRLEEAAATRGGLRAAVAAQERTIEELRGEVRRAAYERWNELEG